MKISQCFDALTIPGKSLSWRSAIAALLLVTLSIAGPLSQAQEQSDPRWVTTWTASPSTLPGQADPQDPAQDQTLRLISHSSVGGDSVRIRLSNTHGNGPITVGAASIALQSDRQLNSRRQQRGAQFLWPSFGNNTQGRCSH